MSGTNTNLIALLRTTLVGMESEGSPDPEAANVSDLKRSVVRAVADLELKKLESEGLEHAGEIASALARAGRAAYIVHPSLLEQSALEAPRLSVPEPGESARSDVHAE